MYNKYYQDELAYLREMGQEFSRAYPEAAHFVGETSSDPDVERLLEGFAFLTARLRQKLDDEFPELTHSLVEMFWPHYLRPVPSLAILQFEPLPQAAREVRSIPRGTEVESVPVDGTACRFRTACDVGLLPLTLEAVSIKADAPPHLSLRFRLPDGVSLPALKLSRLRLHLAGDAAVARAAYLCLCRYVRRVVARAAGGAPVVLEGAAVRPVGFSPEEFLLPFPNASFAGFRALQEYFLFPAKFMFVDVTGLEGAAALGAASTFELLFELARIPEAMPPVTTSHVLLHCSPVVNLFRHDAEAIRLDHERVEYRVQPSARVPDHYEIFTIDRVTGVARESGKVCEYHPLLRFSRPSGQAARFYRHRLHPSVTGDACDVFISPLPPDAPEEIGEVEALSLELTCTNRQLPGKLKVGDIRVPTASSPNFAQFKNITRPTVSVPAPLGGDLHWKLLSHMSLNYLTLIELDALRSVLGLYHFRAKVDRQAEQSLRLLLEGLKKITAAPALQLVEGCPVRGLAVDLEVDEEQMGGEGETHLFGTVLNEFLAQYVSLNAFCRLSFKGLKFGEIYRWPTRIGERIIL